MLFDRRSMRLDHGLMSRSLLMYPMLTGLLVVRVPMLRLLEGFLGVGNASLVTRPPAE
jgi:hypothetical protein